MSDSAELPFVVLAALDSSPPKVRKSAGYWAFLRANPRVAFGGGILCAMLLVTIMAPFIGTMDPRTLAMADRLQPASAAHWMGTDALGRDVYSRILYGGRVSLTAAFCGSLFSCLIGAALGLAAGANRRIDGVIMRIMDGFMSIPPILLAIALMAVTGASMQNVILAVTVVESPRVARMIRGMVLSLREQLYVEAAIASGASGFKIVVRHLLPGVAGPLMVQATFVWGVAMLLEAALSFIGAGVPPSTPSWGNVMSDGKSLWQIHPGLVFMPAAFLSVTVLGVNLLGDGLRKILDPHAAGRRA